MATDADIKKPKGWQIALGDNKEPVTGKIDYNQPLRRAIQ
jgi:hypothetical protein